MKNTFNKNAVAAKLQAALAGLTANTRKLRDYPDPVLIEGGNYPGVWLECAPLEGLVYGRHFPAVAKANHEIFFHFQRPDGYLPCFVWDNLIGASQIQMVVPIAATALETALLTQDEAFLLRAYHSCTRWDDWLARHRDTRGTGLCEAFCEYDTGHDNSPRFHGLPKKCLNDDAALCPRAGALPYLAPDLSATVYGGRRALAAMAQQLGKTADAVMWNEKAEQIRAAILRHCFDPETQCFYDVDAENRFVRLVGDALTRVLGEHVVEQPLFEAIYRRHIRNPDAFWPPFPLPSIAVNDPAFVRGLPQNSWGGASQALTALRAPRWMEHYGKQEDLRTLMEIWIGALLAAPEFMQQMSPWTGEFTTSAGYSPAMCVFIDFARRLGLA
ncbi:MAG: MGH1-like glycoside hydrolase domain-containing protein [Planctomycetota bacterium]